MPNSRSNIKNLGHFGKKEDSNNARKVVEFAETANFDKLEDMPESDIDFTNPKNVLDQYILMEHKGYTILRLPKNKLAHLSPEHIQQAKEKYENHPDKTGIFTDTDFEMYVAKEGTNLDKNKTYLDKHPFVLFEPSSGFDATGENVIPESDIWLSYNSDDMEENPERKFDCASNKIKYPTRETWPMKNSDAHADRMMIIQKDSALKESPLLFDKNCTGALEVVDDLLKSLQEIILPNESVFQKCDSHTVIYSEQNSRSQSFHSDVNPKQGFDHFEKTVNEDKLSGVTIIYCPQPSYLQILDSPTEYSIRRI